MTRNIAIFICAVILNKSAVLACGMIRDGLDFKDDAKEVTVRLNIVSHKEHLGFGEIDCAMYEKFLSRISQMRHLQSLRIFFRNVPYDGLIFDCERLAGLTNLNTLVIESYYNYGTNSVSVSSLSVCKQMPLKELSLCNVNVDDVNVISKFERLEELHCTTEELFRCAPSGLRVLRVYNAEFKGDVDLNRFSRMESLSLFDVKCASIQGLSSLTALESLDLIGVPVKNVSDIKVCPRLKYLRICNCREFDGMLNLADFKDVPLEDLHLENVPLRCIQSLEDSPLESLIINGAEIESINDICRLPNLKELNVVNTKIRFVDKEHVKERFPKLERLWYFYEYVEWD